MNNTKLVLIALALCLCFVLPASAVWSNGNWVPEDALNGYTVDYNPQSGVTSKLKPIDIAAELKESPQSYVGVLKFNLRCGYSTLTREVGIRNDAVPNGAFTFYPIQPDGSFETELVPGNFTVFLPDSNGGQPQTSRVTIVAGQVSYPFNEMLGHAVSGYTEPIVPEVICPSVTTKGWFFKPNVFWFVLHNEADVAAWSTIEYTVEYQKQIPCVLLQVEVSSTRPRPVPKCYEDGTYTGTLVLPRYAPANSDTFHIGVVDYPSGKLKDEKLTSVKVVSCKNAQCGKDES